MSAFDEVLPDTAPYNGPGQDAPPEWVASLLDGLVSALRPTAGGDISADEAPPPRSPTRFMRARRSG